MGWSPKHRAWSFPMATSAGDVLGIRLRLANGKKLSGAKAAMKGFLFPALALTPPDHSIVPGEGTDMLLIAEGPTRHGGAARLGILCGRSTKLHGWRQAAGGACAEAEALGCGYRGRRRRAGQRGAESSGQRLARLLGIGADHHSAPGREGCAGMETGAGRRRPMCKRRSTRPRCGSCGFRFIERQGVVMEDNALIIERGKPRAMAKSGVPPSWAARRCTLNGSTKPIPRTAAAFAAAVAKDRPGIQEAEIEDHLLQDAGRDDTEEKERSQASRLLDIATRESELWHTPENEAYATLDAGHREHWRIRSKAFRQWLAREYFQEHKGAANSEAIQSALNVLEGMAVFARPEDHKPKYPGQPVPGREHPVYVRLAEQSGVIYLDLCDTAWRAAIITPSGSRAADDHLVRFQRAEGCCLCPCR